jgi:hypothetical protein
LTEGGGGGRLGRTERLGRGRRLEILGGGAGKDGGRKGRGLVVEDVWEGKVGIGVRKKSRKKRGGSAVGGGWGREVGRGLGWGRGGERVGGGGVTILGCKTMARFPSPRCLNIFTIFGHGWSQ